MTTYAGPLILGNAAADTVGFYGTTPTAQPAATAQAVVGTAVAVSISATQWAFATSTQPDAIVALVNRLRADLVTLGLIKGSN